MRKCPECGTVDESMSAADARYSKSKDGRAARAAYMRKYRRGLTTKKTQRRSSRRTARAKR